MKENSKKEPQSPIRLLILVKHIDGGTGTFVIQLTRLQKLYKGKIKIRISALEKPLYRQIHKSDVDPSYFSVVPMLPYYYILTPAALWFRWKELLWYKSQVKSFSPDVVLAIDNHCNILACLYKIIFPNQKPHKLILSIHNNISAVTFNKLSKIGRIFFRVICHFIFKVANKIVAVSEGVAEDSQRFFLLKSKPPAIYYGINQAESINLSNKSIPPNYGIFFSKKFKKIISVGRLSRQKDLVTLIKAFYAARIHQPKIKLILIGDGEDKQKMQQLVKQLNLTPHVYFLPWQNNVFPFLRQANAFVLSSYYEGFPYVLLEAMSVGLPIVSTDSPYGPREALANGKYGLLTPIGNSSQLAKKLVDLISNSNRTNYFSQQAIARVKSYTEASMLKNYYNLIKQVVISQRYL